MVGNHRCPSFTSLGCPQAAAEGTKRSQALLAHRQGEKLCLGEAGLARGTQAEKMQRRRVRRWSAEPRRVRSKGREEEPETARKRESRAAGKSFRKEGKEAGSEQKF